MTGKQLKNAILQLAIQGKLVPQDANDEPASVLLAQIRKEKEQLLKAGKLKKKDLETTPITDEEKPFEIPESWEWVHLSEISYVGTGSTPAKHNSLYYGGNIPWIGSSATNYPIIEQATDYITELALAETNCQLYPKGTLIMAMYGQGKTRGQISELAIECCTNQACAAIVPHIMEINSFIKVFLTSQYYKIRSLAEGGAQPNLNLNKVANNILPLPPLAEQRRIVAKIEELMPLVEEYGVAQEKLNQLNEALPEALKKSILQQAIQGKLVPQDANDEPASVLLAQIRKEKEQLLKAGKMKKKDLATTPITDEEKPFEIPEGWEWCRIEEISDSYIGLTYKPTDVAENGTVVLRSSNIQDGRIDLNDKVKVNLSIPEKLIVHENDILICARNGSSKLVGKSALITKEADGMTFGAFMAICKTSFYDFVYQFLQSDLFFSQLREVSGTTTINQLTQKKFNSFIIPLPPLAEQKRIVTKIEELMAMVDGMK